MPPKRRKKAKRKSKKKAGAGGRAAAQAMLRPSAELCALLGRRAMTRGDAVKELWAYARAHSLNEGREIRCDAAMQRVFGVPSMTMFQVTGHLSAHLTSTGTSSSAAGAAAERPSAARRMAAADGERPAKRARTTGSGRRPPESGAIASALRPPPAGPVLCSALLTAVLCGGAGPTAARDLRQLTLPSVSAVHGRLQCYIAAHKLRVPRSDSITLDGTLRSLGSQRVVGRDRLPLSELYSALIGPHLQPVPASRNVVAGGVASEDEDEEDIVLEDETEDEDSESDSDDEEADEGGRGGATQLGGAAAVESASPAVAGTQLGASGGSGGRPASEQRSRRSRVMLSSDEEEESDEELRLSVEPPPQQQAVQRQEAVPAQAAADEGGEHDGPQRLGGGDDGEVTQEELRRRRLRALEAGQQPQQQEEDEGEETAGAAEAVDLTAGLDEDDPRIAVRLDEWCTQADGVETESLTEFLNGRSVRVALQGFVAMDVETLTGGLEGMREAVATEPNPALSFAVGVVAELIQMRSGGNDEGANDPEPSGASGPAVVAPAAAEAPAAAAASAVPAAAPAAAADGAAEAAPSEVGAWLRSVGLGEHVAAFEAERVDMLSLGMLSEADLRDLGLPLGHRRRFQAYMEMFSAEGGAGA